MSHAIVLVAVNPAVKDHLNQQLDPYNENLAVEPYREYHGQDTIDRMIQLLSEVEKGQCVETWALEFYEKYRPLGEKSRLSVEDKCFLLKEWTDSATKYDEETGRYYWMATYNPESKWDWFNIGGRWHGEFIPDNQIKRQDVSEELRENLRGLRILGADGEWHENKELIWFGATTDPVEEESVWHAKWDEIFDEIPGDWEIVAVDYHI